MVRTFLFLIAVCASCVGALLPSGVFADQATLVATQDSEGEPAIDPLDLDGAPVENIELLQADQPEVLPGPDAVAGQLELDRLGLPSDPLTVTQWVCPQEEGVFRALVVAPLEGRGSVLVDSAQVTLSNRSGWIGESVSDSRGNVAIAGVEPGVYALTVAAPGLFAIYAMHVLPPSHPDALRYARTAELSCSSLGAQRVEATVLPYLDEQYELDPVFIDERELGTLIRHVRGNERYRVLRKNGGLAGCIYAAGTGRGRLWRGVDRNGLLDPAELMAVVLFRDGVRVRDTVASRDGRFFIPNLEPGIYSLLAIGRDGVGVVGFELEGDAVEAESASSSSGTEKTRLASTPVRPIDEFSVQVVPADLAAVVDELCCGCCCQPMTTAAGGGGGGGGGGVGGLGGLAALAALAAAASGGGDGGTGIFVPPPAASAMMSGSMMSGNSD